MKVVLLDNIKGIGQVGDVKNVSDGYARNMLLPRGLAKPVTEGLLKDIEALKAKKLQAIALAHAEAQKLAEKINGTKIQLTGKANEQGTLFAGIEAHQIAQTLSKTAGIQIDAAALELPEHIKTLGEHSIRVNLSADVTADIVVEVIAQ